MMFSSVCLCVESGLLTNPINAGLEPMCSTELKIARLVCPFESMEPISEALLKPLSELMKAALVRDSILRMSSLEIQQGFIVSVFM